MQVAVATQRDIFSSLRTFVSKVKKVLVISTSASTKKEETLKLSEVIFGDT